MASVLYGRTLPYAVVPCSRRVDVWEELHPGDPGLTYDPKANPMLGDPAVSPLHADAATYHPGSCLQSTVLQLSCPALWYVHCNPEAPPCEVTKQSPSAVHACRGHKFSLPIARNDGYQASHSTLL